MTKLGSITVAALISALALIMPAQAETKPEFMRHVNAHIIGNGIGLLVKGYKKDRHQIKGTTVLLPYQDPKLGGSGKAKREEAYNKILQVICTGKIKNRAPRHGVQFVMVISDWKGQLVSTVPVHLADCG